MRTTALPILAGCSLIALVIGVVCAARYHRAAAPKYAVAASLPAAPDRPLSVENTDSAAKPNSPLRVPETNPASKSRPKTYRRSEATYPIPNVMLVDRTGTEQSFADVLSGDGPRLMQFVFTSCPTICPVMAQTFGEFQRRLGELDTDDGARDLRLVSVSIDPEHDTPVRLDQFARTFGAGTRWRFLTGQRRDIIAIQQAFQAYTKNKMWHEPLTFLRASAERPWVRLDGLVSADELIAEYQLLRAELPTPPPGDIELGRRIYEDGVLPDGEPLRAIAHGDLATTGKHLKCANCHRASGFASSELETYVPPITAAALFHRRDPQRADLFRELFQEYRPATALARIHDPRMRPAYTDLSLAAALRDGCDPTGRQLDQLMPRYPFGETELRHLVAYLKSRDATQPPGVSQREIHFATVVTPDATPTKVQAMRDVIDAYVRRKNADTNNKRQRPGYSLWYKDDFAGAYRTWIVDTWHLTGTADTWSAHK